MAEIKKILIVDDNEDILIIYKTVLDTAGFTTELARNGDEALDKTKDFKPDLIFLDIMMPGKTGLDVLGTLRSEEIYGALFTPVVMLTNVAENETRMLAANRGASRYVVKSNIDNKDLVDIAKAFEDTNATRIAY